MRVYAKRRSYATPAVCLTGGEPLQGMDTTSGTLPLQRAASAENFWRRADGCVCKRPGYRLQEDLGVAGCIHRVETFGELRLICFTDAEGQSWLRREKNGVTEDRKIKLPVHFLKFGTRLLVFSSGQWLIFTEEGRIYNLCSLGLADITERWMYNVPYGWSLDQTIVTVPLIRSGSSPTGKGLSLYPPNDLVPMVKESFYYAPTHQEAKRNRFCLRESPALQGDLPTDAEGSTANLTQEQKETRKQTLTRSAVLEVRLRHTDAYGNVSYRWHNRAWTYADNISETDAAFWVHTIHEAALADDGNDNVRITYYTDFVAQMKRASEIFTAKTHTLYGVDGRKDRLFVATDNTVLYSALDDPFYFSRQQRLPLGSGKIGIRLLSGEDSVLNVLSDSGAWRIVGKAAQEAGEYALDAAFSVSLRLPCPKPLGESCVVAGGELLFYSEQGLCAVTPSGVLDERCVQIRSRRLGELLKSESNVKLHAVGDWVILAGEKGWYLFDLQRRIRVMGDAYSSHGYEAYFWPELSADSFGENLSFYKDGKYYRFCEGTQAEDFHDEVMTEEGLLRRPIAARWQSGSVATDTCRCKYYEGLFVQFEGTTAVRITAESAAGERLLYDYGGVLGRFDYDAFRYGQLCYTTHLKKIHRFPLALPHRRFLRLRLENDIIDQPFCLRGLILEYR